MDVIPYWDILTMCFYLALACIGACSLYYVKTKERKTEIQQKLTSKNYVVWGVIWTLTATFRYVSSSNKIGGTDAYSYAMAFEQVFDPGRFAAERLRHFGIAWQYLCKIIHLICDDYHFFFMLIHGVVAFAFIYFLNTFALTRAGYAAMLPVFYLYLRGYNTYRTELAIALLMIGLVLLWKRRYVQCTPFIIFAVLFQTATLLYVCFIPFYIFYKKRKLSIKQGLILSVLAGTIGYLTRWLLVSGTIKISYYANYATLSLTNSFFTDYWKIVFGQLLLTGILLFFRKKIWISKDKLNEKDIERFKFIWIMCIFDLILIPITYLIHLWRGYEYFYLARLIMWSHIIVVVKDMFNRSSRNIITIGTVLIFGVWLVFCVWNNWERSGFMPYIFAPSHSIS